MTTAFLATADGNPENQDRGAVIDSEVGLVLIVADGAGGQSGGTEAAVMAVEWVRQRVHELADAEACADVLRRMDRAISDDRLAGETTCVLAVITAETIYGASVGDSGAWVVGGNGIANLTEGQVRKPFLGSGAAWPVAFSYRRAENETLLLATDGLLKYTSAERIKAICVSNNAGEASQQLIALVRTASGALPDDVTVIVARL